MRLFLAVEPDHDVRAALVDLVAEVRRRCGADAGAFRWVDADNIHLTLHFIGAFDVARVPALVDALGRTLDEPPFDITPGPVGFFPPHGLPRAMYAAIDGGRAPLLRIHAELGRRLRAAGVAVETRPFTPHVTLARARNRDRAGVRRAAAAITAILTTDSSLESTGRTTSRSNWHASEIQLMQSDLGGPRPVHTAVHTIALG